MVKCFFFRGLLVPVLNRMEKELLKHDNNDKIVLLNDGLDMK